MAFQAGSNQEVISRMCGENVYTDPISPATRDWRKQFLALVNSMCAPCCFLAYIRQSAGGSILHSLLKSSSWSRNAKLCSIRLFHLRSLHKIAMSSAIRFELYKKNFASFGLCGSETLLQHEDRVRYLASAILSIAIPVERD